MGFRLSAAEGSVNGYIFHVSFTSKTTSALKVLETFCRVCCPPANIVTAGSKVEGLRSKEKHGFIRGFINVMVGGLP